MHHNKPSSLEQARQKTLTQPQGFSQNPYINRDAQNAPLADTINPMSASFDTANFAKGVLLGAIGAYLLTNENAQKAIFKGLAKTTNMFQVGMEEMKERFEDAQAELEAEKNT